MREKGDVFAINAALEALTEGWNPEAAKTVTRFATTLPVKSVSTLPGETRIGKFCCWRRTEDSVLFSASLAVSEVSDVDYQLEFSEKGPIGFGYWKNTCVLSFSIFGWQIRLNGQIHTALFGKPIPNRYRLDMSGPTPIWLK